MIRHRKYRWRVLLWALLVPALMVAGTDTGQASTGGQIAYRDGRIDMDVRSRPLDDILGEISAKTGLQVYVFDPLSSEPISIAMSDRAPEEVVRSLLKGYNYAVVFGSKSVGSGGVRLVGGTGAGELRGSVSVRGAASGSGGQARRQAAVGRPKTRRHMERGAVPAEQRAPVRANTGARHRLRSPGASAQATGQVARQAIGGSIIRRSSSETASMNGGSSSGASSTGSLVVVSTATATSGGSAAGPGERPRAPTTAAAVDLGETVPGDVPDETWDSNVEQPAGNGSGSAADEFSGQGAESPLEDATGEYADNASVETDDPTATEPQDPDAAGDRSSEYSDMEDERQRLEYRIARLEEEIDSGAADAFYHRWSAIKDPKYIFDHEAELARLEERLAALQ